MVLMRPALHGSAIASLGSAELHDTTALMNLRGGAMEDHTTTTRLLAELVGTFGLLLAVRISAKVPEGWTRPVQFPVLCTLGCLIYFFGPLSGASLNPVVSVSMLISGEMSLSLFLLYTVVQVIGATAATKVVALLG